MRRCAPLSRAVPRALLVALLAVAPTAARGDAAATGAPATALAESASRLALRVDPLAELYFAVRAQAAREEQAPLAGHEAAVAAARRIQASLGAFGGWGPLDAELFTAGDAATLLRRFEALPETMRQRGRDVAIRADAVALARELVTLEPRFVAGPWPARRAALEATVAALERDFLPAHRQALAYMASSLGIADPGIEVPVLLVTECHPPGASTYYLGPGEAGGEPASVVAAPAFAAGQLAETILHEATHGLDIAARGGESAFGTLRAHLAERGLGPRDRLFHDLPHALMFVQAAETMRRLYAPAHVPYGESSGVYDRLGTADDPVRRLWPQVLDGALARDEALRRMVDELVPPPAPASPP
jgi:hypothetical protein